MYAVALFFSFKYLDAGELKGGQASQIDFRARACTCALSKKKNDKISG